MDGANVFIGVDAGTVMRVLLLCIGSVELVKAVADQDFRKSAIISVSALVGWLAGVFLAGIDPVSGILIGLSASGTITALQNVAQKHE